VDVLADLDMLAEFPDGCIYTKDIPIVSYSSYGRGSYLEEEPSSGPPSPLCNMVKLTSVDACNQSHSNCLSVYIVFM
jgi:hypothetical protein